MDIDGRSPRRDHNGPTARTESLGDFVDIATDRNNSVLKDPEDSNYCVRQNGVFYIQEPPSEETSDE